MKKNSVLTTERLVLCALFTALTAVGAFIQIPVPGMDYFTLQFMFVLLAGMLLGSAHGALAVGVYVLLGLFGLPIFAAGGGLGYIFRPSFGFLAGFILTAFIVGFLCERMKKKTYVSYLLAAFAGFVVTYGIGLVYKYFMLNYYVGDKTSLLLVLADCFPLDMPGDVILCLISSALALRLRPVFLHLGLTHQIG